MHMFLFDDILLLTRIKKPARKVCLYTVLYSVCTVYVMLKRSRECLSYLDVCPMVHLRCYRRPITLFRYADTRIVNIMKLYIERNYLQLEVIRYFDKW